MEILLLALLITQEGPGGPKDIFQELDTMTSSTSTMADTPDIEPSKKVPVARGILGVNVVNLGGRVRVKSIKPGGPAERAGIQRWDTIVAIDGKPVTNRSTYVALMRGRAAGETVGVQWAGGDKRLRTTKIVLDPGRRIAADAGNSKTKVTVTRREARRRRGRRAPTGPRRRWYGWQPLVADAASLVLVVFTNSSAVVGGLGLIGFGIGGPLAHFFHGNVKTGLLSMGMRVGIPALTVLGTLAICDNEARVCDDAGAYFAIGALLTFVAIPAIDAAVLSWQTVEPKKPKTETKISVVPSLGPTADGEGVSFGVSGLF